VHSVVRRLNNAMLLLAYNCSPSFNWRRHLDKSEIAKFQREVGAGYFDQIALAVDRQISTGAMEGSTESSQFA
jgi:isocitrate lyase